jgi:hypothetical protein
MVREPRAEGGSDPLDVGELSRTDLEELIGGDFVIEVDQAVPIAGQQPERLTFFRRNGACVPKLDGDLLVLAHSEPVAFGEDVAADVEDRLEAASQTGLRGPEVSAVAEKGTAVCEGQRPDVGEKFVDER